MSTFLDSSALVKRYADEPGWELVRGIETAVVSVLARVEIPAALWRKQRLGELDLADAGVLVEMFEWDWHQGQMFAIVPVTSAVLEEAGRAVARFPLRAYDAVQLATCILARAADPDLTTLVCFDARLASAARLEGFRVEP